MAKPDTSLERLPRRVQKPLTMGNHKRRSAWFRARAGWPDPSPPATLRQRAIEHMGRMRPAAGRRAGSSIRGVDCVCRRIWLPVCHCRVCGVCHSSIQAVTLSAMCAKNGLLEMRIS